MKTAREVELEKAIDWVLNDFNFRPPWSYQLDIVERWMRRLERGLKFQESSDSLTIRRVNFDCSTGEVNNYLKSDQTLPVNPNADSDLRKGF